MRRTLLSLMAVVALASLPGIAKAHGELISTDPAAGERLDAPPSVISFDFSDPVTKDNRFTVLDGCGEDVLTAVEGEGSDKSLRVAPGSPGRWEVTYTVISAVDGHDTHKRIVFSVAGKKECGRPATDGSPGAGGAVPPEAPDEPADFPFVPVIVGAAIVMGAVGIRAFSSR